MAFKAGGERREFASRSEAAAKLGVSSADIRRVVAGERVEAGGWQFEEPSRVDEFGEEVQRAVGADEKIEGLGQTPREVVLNARKWLAEYVALDMAIARGERQPPHPGWKSSDAIKGLKESVLAAGQDWSVVADGRSDADKLLDAVETLVSNPEQMMEFGDGVLVALETGLNDALKGCEGYLTDKLLEVGHDPVTGLEVVPVPKCRADVCRSLLAIVRRVMKCRELARMKDDPKGNEIRRFAVRASVPLRAMVYCSRSTHKFSNGHSDAYNAVPKSPWHLCKMAVDVRLAEEQGDVTKYGLLLPGTRYFDAVRKVERVFPGTGTESAMLLVPPGHGKTQFLVHWMGCRAQSDPSVQMQLLHAVDEEAKKSLGAVKALFDLDTAQGRRFKSLFPAVELDKKDNNAEKMRLKSASRTKNPTLSACGVGSAGLGGDINALILDDVVPGSDVDQPTDRERRIDRVRRTWMTRIRGHGFTLFSGYFHHHGDLMMFFYKVARRAHESKGRDASPMVVCAIPVGGAVPANGRGVFESVWQEGYSSADLRRKYHQLGSAVYAANYMLKPVTEEDKLIKQVRFYDPDNGENKVFELDPRTERHYSLDPAATKEKKSDSAGCAIAYTGYVTRTEMGPTGEVIYETPVVRIRSVREFKATQMDLTDSIVGEASVRPLDRVHIEIAGGYGTSVRDALTRYEGVSTANVTEHTHRGLDKTGRLRAVAWMIESFGPHANPVVEFAGKFVNGENGEGGHWVPIDEGMRRLTEDYIVNHKVSEGFHTLDAVTQLCNWAAMTLGIVRDGEVSRQVGRKRGESEKARSIREWFADLGKDKDGDSRIACVSQGGW